MILAFIHVGYLSLLNTLLFILITGGKVMCMVHGVHWPATNNRAGNVNVI